MSRADFNFEIDPRSWRRVQSVLTRLEKPERGLKNALSRTVSQVNKTTRQAVAGELTLKKSSINERVKVVKRPRANDLSGVVRFDRLRRNPSLASFRPTKDTRKATFDPSGKGVTVQVRRNKPKERYPRSFIAKGRGGVPLVLRRSGKSRRPLTSLTGPTPLGVFMGEPGLAESVLGRGGEFLLQQVRKEYEKQLKKK